MSGEARRSVDGLRMLREAVDAVMAENALDDEERVIGVVTTLPRGNLSIERYDAAIDQLLQWGALMRDAETDRANQLLSNMASAPEAFKITRTGIEKLREWGM
jgi:hypothetical protein